MEIGNKILELRKQHNLSQEQLAELLCVARQTISKWELSETHPDLEQTKEISKIFNVSLDELTNNNIKDVLIEKIDNMNKLTKTIINILKIILLLVIILVIILVSIIFFKEYFDVKPVSVGQSIVCTIEDNEYIYEVRSKYETEYVIDNFYTDDKYLNIDVTKYNNVDMLLKDIRDDFISRGGNCK